MAECACTAGSCDDCGAACATCDCTCDGLDPFEVKRKQKKTAKKTGRSRKGLNGESCLESARDVWNAFALSETQFKKLPSEVERDEGTWSEASWNCMVQAAEASVNHVAQILCPGDHENLLRSVARRILGEGDRQKELDRLLKVMGSFVRESPNASIQRRAVQACLVKGISQSTLEKAKEKYKFCIGNTARGRAYHDYKAVVQGRKELAKRFTSRIEYDKKVAARATEFILSPENIRVLYWDKQKIQLSRSETVVLPLLVKRNSVKKIYDMYLETIRAELEEQGKSKSKENGNSETERKSTISRGSFYNLVRMLAKNEHLLSNSTDYRMGVLLSEQVVTLQNLIEEMDEVTLVESLLTRLNTLAEFLHAGLDAHLEDESIDRESIPTHNMNFSLGKESEMESCVPQSKCPTCDFLSNFFKSIRDVINDKEVCLWPDTQKESALRLVEVAEEKIDVFFAHRLRVVNERRTIKAIYNLLEKDSEYESCAFVRIGSITRSEILSSSDENLQSHFGKKKLMWYTSAITFYRKDPENPQATNRVDVHLDQILDGSNEHNWFTVGAMIESMVHWIQKELPHIQKLILHSENEDCYTSPALLALLAIVNTKNSVQIIRFLHTECKDGKDLLENHFVEGMAHVLRFMRRSKGNKIQAITSPKGLAAGLASKGGVDHSGVQLVCIGKRSIQIRKVAENASDLFPSTISSCSDVIFLPSEGPSLMSIESLKDAAEKGRDFQVRHFRYPAIGAGVLSTFSIKPESVGEEVAEDDSPPTFPSQAFLVEGEDCIRGGEKVSLDNIIIDDWDKVSVEDESENTGESDTDVDPSVPSFPPSLIDADLPESKTVTAVSVILCSGTSNEVPDKHTTVEAKGDRVRHDLVAFCLRKAAEILSSGTDIPLPLTDSTETPNCRSRGWACHVLENYDVNQIEIGSLGIENALLEGKLTVYRKEKSLPLNKSGGSSFQGEEENHSRLNTDATAKDGSTKKRGRPCMIPYDCVEFLERLRVENPTMMPREALARFRSKFPNLTGLDGKDLQDKTIKAKWSSMPFPNEGKRPKKTKVVV